MTRKGNSARNDYASINEFKGILIFLIVLGHNTLFSQFFPLLFSALYNFHVACFLLLVFIYPAPSSPIVLVNRVVRYLVPHSVFFLVACGLYFYYYVYGNDIDVTDWLKSVVFAMVVSSEEAYKEAAGFRVFWFLPALTTLLCLRYLYYRASPLVRLVAIIGLCVIHGVLGFIPPALLPFFPWSTPLVLFIFPLGLLVDMIWRTVHAQQPLYWLSFLFFLPAIYLSVTLKSYAGLAGDPDLYSIAQPIRLVFHDALLIASFFFIMGVARKCPRPIFEILGVRTLFIFLSHPFIWQGLVRSGLVGWMDVNMHPALSLPLSVALTLTSAVAGALLTEKIPVLHHFIFPRGLDDWPLRAQRAD